MMAEFPIMPVKVADLLADTMHMDPAEFGGYVRILLAMWLNGGRLNVTALHKITGLGRQKWDASRETIMRPLTVIDDTVSQKRLESIRLGIKEKREKLSVASALGVAARNARRANQMVNHMVQPNGSTEWLTTKTKKERESSILTSQSDVAPQQEGKKAATEVASKRTALQVSGLGPAGDVASGELAAKIMRDAKRGYG